MRVVHALNRFDVVIIHAEKGLYGGLDGEDLLDVLDGVSVPVTAVLHTVSAAPTPHQRFVVQRIADAAAAVVVLSQGAAVALLEAYPINANRVAAIPHGAIPHGAVAGGATAAAVVARAPTILTWDLLAPCQGIEWAIAALAQLRDLRPMRRYRAIGRTDPKVLAQHGESYRDFLYERAKSSGMSGLVGFNPAYRASDQLTSIVRDADLVLPYHCPRQFVWGALSEAVAARRPVVATDFPHARELPAGEPVSWRRARSRGDGACRAPCPDRARLGRDHGGALYRPRTGIRVPRRCPQSPHPGVGAARLTQRPETGWPDGQSGSVWARLAVWFSALRSGARCRAVRWGAVSAVGCSRRSRG